MRISFELSSLIKRISFILEFLFEIVFVFCIKLLYSDYNKKHQCLTYDPLKYSTTLLLFISTDAGDHYELIEH